VLNSEVGFELVGVGCKPIGLHLSRLSSHTRKIVEGCRRVRVWPSGANPAALVVIGICPVLFQSASAVLQRFTSGYDPVREAVSSLVFSPFGWIQTAMFYLTGASLIALAVVFYLHIKPRFKVGFLVLGLLGAAFAVIGINRPALPGAEASLSSVVHVGASVFIAAAFPMACLLLGPILRSGGHTFLRWYTIVAGISSMSFFFVGGAILVLHFSFLGLFERIMLWNGQLWVELVCAQLLLDRYRARKRVNDLSPGTGTVLGLK
jgi:hypothetical protein